MPSRPRKVLERIVAFNHGREPERLKLKYEAIRSGAFRFLRGTCHLFYEDFPRSRVLMSAPRTWISGDLHLENFGAYKGDDRIIYFDINDFDEALLAPCTMELARFLVGVILAASDYGVPPRQAIGLCRCFLGDYAAALAKGKARRVERLVAEGLVRDLLDGVLRRTRIQLLEKRTELHRGRRTLLLGKRALPVAPAERRQVTAFIKAFAKKIGEPPFYRVLDVARRVAGTGSLGLRRYVILVEGKGSPDDNYLLDLKEAWPSALATQVPVKQPRWPSESARVVTIQDRMQAVAPALLHAAMLNGRPFILKELQPSEDRLSLEEWGGKIKRFETIIGTMANVTAWSELRSAGRDGSATADELIAFAGRKDWPGELVRFAQSYAKQVEADWKEFQRAAAEGEVPMLEPERVPR
jgi:uncharacterized protein (DUF2252 family)